MAARWHCLIGQQQYGPFTSDQIQQLVQQGQLQPEHFVRTETDSRWTSASDLPGLFPAAQAAPKPPADASATNETKKKTAIRTVSVPVPPPTPQAPSASPAATPLAAPPTAVPVAVPASVAAAPRPAVAVPVARPAVPVASTGPALAPTVRAARPIPVHPLVPPALAAGSTRGPSGEPATVAQKRRRRKNSQLAVGGLAAAMVLLIVVAIVVLNRRPGPKKVERPRTASSTDPGRDPEIEMPTVLASPDEASEIADPVPAAVAASVEPLSKPKSDQLPPVSKWLAADRQKGGLLRVVRLGVGSAWRESADGKPDVLNVEITITNLSPDKLLDFSGWRLDVQPQAKLRAVLADDEDSVLPPTPSTAARRPAARRSLAPGESETERLCFLLPERESQYFRLALPYAALGQVGYLGFELPVEMIRGRPPGEQDMAPPATPASTPETLAPAVDAWSEKEKEPKKEPEKEPEKIPDIRRLIEEETREMESPQEGEPSEKQPMAESESP